MKQQTHTLFIYIATAISTLLAVIGTATTARAHVTNRLTVSDGLAGITASALKEDASGKMWIGTSNGVTLYNGTSLKNYSLPHSKDGQPGHCFELDLDRQGNLWAATKNGLYKLPRHSNGFEAVSTENGTVETVLCLGDTVLMGTRSGLYERLPSGSMKKVELMDGRKMGNTTVRSLCRWKGMVWVSTRNGVVRLDARSHRTTYLPLEQPSGLSRLVGCGSYLWVGTKNNGLFCLNPTTGEYRHVDGVGNVISNVSASGDTAVCVSVDGGGGYVLDARSGEVKEHYCVEAAGRHHLSSDALYTFVIGSNGTRWLGMYLYGLVYYTPWQGAFQPYTFGAFTTRGMSVSAAYADGKRRLIVSGSGFWLVDEQTAQTRYFDTDGLGLRFIKQFLRHGNYYYIASYDGGLLRLDAQTLTLSRLPGCRQLEYASVMQLVVDHQQRLWAVTNEGLFVIGSDGRLLRNYTERNSHLPSGVYSLWFDPQDNGWIGTSSGLCLYLSADDTFKQSGFPEDFFNTAPSLHLSGMGNEVYAWTAMHLYHSDLNMTNYGEIAIPQEIMNERCIDFAVDQQGNKWLITESGFFFLGTNPSPITQHPSPNTQHPVPALLHLSTLTGINGQVTTSGALGVNDSLVWVGTNDGLMIARKATISSGKLFSIPVTMEIDYFFRDEQLADHGELLAVNDSHELELPWNIVAEKLVIRPALLSYTPQEGSICEYSIDGSDWHLHPVSQVIELPHLFLGSHELRLRLPGMDSTLATYTIHVRPHWLFYVECTLLLLALLVLLHWWRWRKRTNTLLQEHHETEEALIEEINAPANQPQAEEPAAERQRYQRSRISDNELARLYRQMDDYVKAEKPYLNRDSKMSDIATALGVSPSLLSQVFTLHLGEPYYDYINKYRLEAFKQLIREGKHRQYTITALSEQCGFKKTAFFSTFRKVEGTTPTEFIQRLRGER